MVRRPWLAAAAVLLGALLLWAHLATQDTPRPQAPTSLCDRSCLEQHLDTFMAALSAHDAATLPLSRGFQYLENNQHLPTGEGGWRTLQGFGSYRHYFADPERGTAAVVTTARENDEDALATLRIRIVEGQFTEAELVLIHDPEGAERYARRNKPSADWLETVPEEERLSREELLETANRYYGALESNDGRGDYSFFAEDCDRIEQGKPATHAPARPYLEGVDAEFVTMGCRAQFETGLFGFITRIRDRRFDLIDSERGVVFASAMLDMNNKYPGIPLTDGKTFTLPAWFSPARSLMVGDAFRIRDGHVQRIETLGREFPYAMPAGLRPSFGPSQEVPGGKAADATRRCDAACLESLAEQVLRAMQAHDPLQAPMIDTARYVENGQRLEFYDGLWGSLGEVSAYRLKVVEPTQHEIVVHARVRERDTPGLLALRIRALGDRVAAIEAEVVREERPTAETLFRARGAVDPAPARLQKPDPLFAQVLPPEHRADVEELVSLVTRYFDAIEQGQGNAVRFTPDCLHRENGLVVTDNPQTGFAPHALGCAAQLEGGYGAYITRVRDRHILTIDEARGLIVAAAYYDIPGTVKAVGQKLGAPYMLPARLGRPQSRATWQLFRIEDGAIRRIESLERIVPFGARAHGSD